MSVLREIYTIARKEHFDMTDGFYTIDQNIFILISLTLITYIRVVII